MKTKRLFTILVLFILSIMLTACRISLDGIEIKCDDNGCTETQKDGSSSGESGSESGGESGSDSGSESGGSGSSGGGTEIKPGDGESGQFDPDRCEGGKVCGGDVACGSKYNQVSPPKGIFGSFPYYDSEPDTTTNRNSLEMCPAWRNKNFTTVKTTCSNGKEYKWTVNVKAASTFKKVQEKFCQFITTGVDGIVYSEGEITVSGPTVIRYVSNTKSISLHSYGIAIDINPSNSYTINGKKYSTPYGRDIKKYEAFVNALGSEDDPRNINYILWKKVFQPLGFSWGGNWGRSGNGGVYDGMHFEIDWRQTK